MSASGGAARLDDATLTALEDAARAATSGPWFGVENARHIHGGPDCGLIADAWETRDALHIAAASPDVVLALIAEVRALREVADQRDDTRKAHDGE